MILNGLATALIGASSYNMQCLVAPSRSEVDLAHSEDTWLDIGVPSVRNLRHISRSRVALWLVLALSTIPLHLLWNSAIFSTLQNNSYTVVGVSTDTLQNQYFNCSDLPGMDASYQAFVCGLYTSASGRSKAILPLTRLELGECIQQYGTDIQSKWSNLVVAFDRADLDDSCQVSPIITDNEDDEAHFLAYDTSGIFWSRGYRCYEVEGFDHTDQIFFPKGVTPIYYAPSLYNESSSFYQGSYVVDHCFAMKSSEVCKLGFSLPILILVACSNAIKLFAMIYTFKIVKAQHIMTLGDAIASFLEVPDDTTIGCCLKRRASFKTTSFRFQTRTIPPRVYIARDAKNGKLLQLIWFRAVSMRRWTSILLM